MTMYTHAGPIPAHKYVWIEPNAIGEHGWLRAVWFGITSHPGRAWGCHVMLECGAVYRSVPLHKLATKQTASPSWLPSQAQTWDAYGWTFSTLEYPFLSSMNCTVKLADNTLHDGMYVFTAVPVGDAFSLEPEQAKEFYFIELNNGRFTAQPTNHILIQDKSFCKDVSWPDKWIKRQTEWWSCEDPKV